MSRIHHQNLNRKRNTDRVKQLIAQFGEKGAPDRSFRAYVALELGARLRTIDEYLDLLLTARQIEYDPDAKVWKLPTEEGEEKEDGSKTE